MDNYSPSRLSPDQLGWYVVSTKPNYEKQAEQNIGRSGVECFLPLLQEQKIIRRKARALISPLFPGYLFVRINLLQHYRIVNYSRGVRKIVEFGSRPVEVESAVIDAIKTRMLEGSCCVQEHPQQLRSGQLVKIKEGLLAGIEAVFLREMPGDQRAMLLLHTLAMRARAVVNIDQLAPYVAA